MPARYDIVVPHYGMTSELTKLCLRCLQTMRQYSNSYRLIFVDNASPQFEEIRPELDRHPHLLIRNTTNLGFVRATEQGIWMSDAPYLVLMNNDTEAAPNWLEKLCEPLVDNVAMCGPRTTTSNSWQGRTPAGEGWYIIPTNYMLAFFCCMVRRDFIEKVGFQHEQFVKHAGFGGDDWLCHVAHNRGWRLALRNDLVIPHHHRSTMKAVYGSAVPQMQREAVALYHSLKSSRARS